jgi:pimeloyl-ACP methyl ester carboxylesterase
MEPALYAIYPALERPPEVERMDEVIAPLFQHGQIEKGRAEFFALFGWSADGPVSDNWRCFGYEQPVVTSWCPSEAELQQVTLPVLIMEGRRSPALLRNICRLLARQLGNSTTVTLEHQDHLAPWTAPQVVAAELTAFISEYD